jgi:hypothetical protein
VRFVYRRSWEDDAAAARVFTATLSVKKQGAAILMNRRARLETEVD